MDIQGGRANQQSNNTGGDFLFFTHFAFGSSLDGYLKLQDYYRS